MEVVAIFGVLLRHKRLVALGVAASIAITILVAHRLTPSTAAGDLRGAAATRVLIDERRSLVAGLRRFGPMTIATRAAILADLVADAPATREIAAKAGIPLADLGVRSPALGAPVAVGPLPDRAAEAQIAFADAHRDTVVVTQEPTLPILDLRAEARDPATARRLVLATADALRGLLAARAASAARGTPSIVVRPLGSVQVGRVATGGAAHPILAVFGGILFLVSWCTGIVVAAGLLRTVRKPERRLEEASAAMR
jgi:hypothetical protein